jgi:uncharacterized protein (DUF1697 family)
MPKLRELLADAGMEEVQTYLQSGNVVLSSSASPKQLGRDCEQCISKALGLEVAAVVRTRAELARVVRANPLAKLATEPKLYQVSFCSKAPLKGRVGELAECAAGGEQVLVRGRELYAWYPHGVGRSKLAARLSDKGLGVTATARNWKTVTKLLELAGD